jgi:hypothetical protein
MKYMYIGSSGGAQENENTAAVEYILLYLFCFWFVRFWFVLSKL